MAITTITRFHAAAGREDDLRTLVTAGRNRMRTADGCTSFELLQDESDSGAMIFIQIWASHEAHDRAFAERIIKTGHLDKVLGAIDEPIVQHSYQVTP
jgi:quinol monooxygenase YgiN